jgi:hypothetical protein
MTAGDDAKIRPDRILTLHRRRQDDALTDEVGDETINR